MNRPACPRFSGVSPFGDGELEALDGLPEGFDIPQMPESLKSMPLDLTNY
jgi:hypothetical protein